MNVTCAGTGGGGEGARVEGPGMGVVGRRADYMVNMVNVAMSQGGGVEGWRVDCTKWRPITLTFVLLPTGP